MNTPTILLGLFLAALLFYLHYERKSLLKTLDAIAKQPALKEIAIGEAVAEALRPYFTCYYCNHSFPMKQLEQIGQYAYCLEHGLARQAKMNGEHSNHV